MPQLGADMAAGKLTEWLKKPGERVKRGDIVAVVETDKGAIEVEIFENGTLDRVLVEPGAKVPVGTVLAMVRGDGEAPSAAPPMPRPMPAVAPSVPKPRPAVAVPERRAPAGPTGRLRVSPAAARLAAERGVDLAGLRGTGPDGAIRIADVAAAPAEVAPAAEPVAALPEPATPAEAIRRAIAAAMSRSNREIPHYYLSHAIDVSRALDWLARGNEQRPVAGRLLYGVLLVKAVALALRDYPEFNGFWRDGRFAPGAGIHVGTAIALRGGGLIAPAVHDADAMTLDALMASLRDLVARARAMRLRSSELADSTITVTSLGDQGVDAVFGVIYPPQVALVGFGTPAERPWADQGTVTTRRVIQASLAADHRASDGHRGALFLARVGQLLQEPEKL